MNKKEQEALRRLKVLTDRKNGLHKDVVKEFRKGQKFFSEYNDICGALYWLNGAPNDVLNKIKELEKNGDVVYHATHETMKFSDDMVCECWDLFVVTDEDVADDEFGQGMRNDFDNYGIQFAYVLNQSIPEFSEFGSIQIATVGGGVVRVS